MTMKVMLRRVIRTAVTASALALGFVLALPCTSHAQILVSKQGPVVYGHHHLNTTNMDAQKKFSSTRLAGSSSSSAKTTRRSSSFLMCLSSSGQCRRRPAARWDNCESHRLLRPRPEAAHCED